MPTQRTMTAETAETAAAAPRGRGLIAGAMVLAAALIVAYWVIWFAVDRNLLASSRTDVYFGFENAFPAADAWLAATLIVGAVGLLRRRPWGLLATLLAGGAGIYLGCMDVLFDLENGIYLVPSGGDPTAVFIEVAINVLTFALGAVVIAYIWRQRAWLLHAPGQP